MLTANQIREAFKDFFHSKGHHVVASAPMVIKDDPTLMFTNAGMNQFKDIILGNVQPQWLRATDSQKCLRVSGKHNDLEEVGHDTYHHTMFEMLGNWSFGDYFKHEAIDYAWEFLTEVMKIDPKLLYATVFEGSTEDGIARDDEAARFWEKHLPKDHIINGNKHDNFWEMGDTGPCGPCSEIHIDLRSDEEKAAIPGAELVNKDNPLVMEIWNLVFMTYDRKADGSLAPLPHKVIDTGMGFERLCRIMQGKTSNYDTDIFLPIINHLSRLCGKAYGADERTDVAMRVVADHIRAIAFSIADGQLPGNAKAGYVIRRILRRAVRYGYTFLDLKHAFMHELVDTLVAEMGDAYPELKAQTQLIKHVIREEEESFLRTLSTGIRLIDEVIARAKAEGKTVIAGSDVFQLYDTYGFPLDLTELILKEHGLSANIDEFNTHMQQQKERARNATAVEASDWEVVNPGVSEFVGYDCTECTTTILRYRQVKQKNKTVYQLVLAQTPFYGEMGGQVGDKGTLSVDGQNITVLDTKRENNQAVLIVSQLPTNVKAEVTAKVDTVARQAISCNHSATHILHEALRTVLGNHVEQKGSYVEDKMLRFDFAHFQKLTTEEIRQVERLANETVRRAIPRCEFRNIPIQQAKDMGALALFGEKYGETVRVVQYGSSIELCGGTHVENTGNIGMIKIVSESSIAAGIRRIEAITGAEVERTLAALEDTIADLRSFFNNTPDLRTAIQKSLDENSQLRSKVEGFVAEKITGLKELLIEKASLIEGIRVVKLHGAIAADIAKGVAFAIKSDAPENTVYLAATQEQGRPTLTVFVSDDLVTRGINAGTIVRTAAKAIQGGGGGQPHFAQAGGKNADGLGQAMELMLQQLKA